MNSPERMDLGFRLPSGVGDRYPGAAAWRRSRLHPSSIRGRGKGLARRGGRSSPDVGVDLFRLGLGRAPSPRAQSRMRISERIPRARAPRCRPRSRPERATRGCDTTDRQNVLKSLRDARPSATSEGGHLHFSETGGMSGTYLNEKLKSGRGYDKGVGSEYLIWVQ